MDNVPYWFRPHFFDALVYLAAFLDNLLPAGFPLNSELAVPAFGTVVCKAQEVEGLRLALSGVFAVLCRISAKFQQPTLFFHQTQPKVPHSASQAFIDSLGLHLVLKAYYEAVRINDQPAVSLLPRLDPLFKPPRQHIMHVDVRYDRAAY